MTAPIRLSAVDFAYSGQPSVLSGLDIEFAGGLVHAITGPSGCGKSTLMYIAGLMLRPRRGDVFVLGENYASANDFKRARARERHVGFVFQDALLDPSLTVAENIAEAFPWRPGRRALCTRADEHLDRLGLAHLRSRRAASLSGGQAQRVALVRSLAKEPGVVLADEPTGNLDSRSGEIVFDELAAYARDAGRVCIIVTHDERLALRCDTMTGLSSAGPGPEG